MGVSSTEAGAALPPPELAGPLEANTAGAGVSPTAGDAVAVAAGAGDEPDAGARVVPGPARGTSVEAAGCEVGGGEGAGRDGRGDGVVWCCADGWAVGSSGTSGAGDGGWIGGGVGTTGFTGDGVGVTSPQIKAPAAAGGAAETDRSADAGSPAMANSKL